MPPVAAHPGRNKCVSRFPGFGSAPCSADLPSRLERLPLTAWTNTSRKNIAISPPKMVAGFEVPASWKYLQDFKTGAEYQMYHALALRRGRPGRRSNGETAGSRSGRLVFSPGNRAIFGQPLRADFYRRQVLGIRHAVRRSLVSGRMGGARLCRSIDQIDAVTAHRDRDRSE